MIISKHFRRVFLIRFLSYFFIILGTLTLILIAEPVVNEEMKYRMDRLLGKKYKLAPRVVTSATLNPTPTLVPGQITRPTLAPTTVVSQRGGGFGSILGGSDNIIVPVSTDFGIVIEKINANAKVVADVNPADEKAYTKALADGVAHAKGTVYPGQKGNIYLFSHSTDAPWNFIRFNAIFYLLNKLESGDQISLFYQGRRYDYIVYDKQIVKPEDTQFLVDSYDSSVLTLQTCDPPGTLLNRLVVRARLAAGG